jgi:hypothetical protein
MRSPSIGIDVGSHGRGCTSPPVAVGGYLLTTGRVELAGSSQSSDRPIPG